MVQEHNPRKQWGKLEFLLKIVIIFKIWTKGQNMADDRKSMIDFVSEFYKRLIFLEMPDEQFVRFCEYVDKNDLGGNMKYWRDQLLRKDGDTFVKDPAAKLYVRKELPDPIYVTADDNWQLDDSEWEKMYNAFNDAFQSMYAKRKSLEYPEPNEKALKFLDRFFGDTAAVPLFSYTTASHEAENTIKDLYNLLTGPHGERLKQWFNSSDNRGQYFNDEFSWDDLIRGLNDKKYNKDPKFRQRMIDIAGALDNDMQRSDSVVRKIVGLAARLDFSTIASGFENKTVSPDKISLLKANYRELLTTLHKTPKVFEVFQPNDSSKISKSLNDARTFLDYNNPESKSYVPPKLEDDLTLPQRISKWWDDTYENYFEKYTRARGDHIFMSPYAKEICKAIDKEKIKPTDGLAKILESKDAIKKRLSDSKNAPNHFEWFANTLNDLKDKMPKAFASALKDGTRMRAIVSQMILRAVRENKIDEAKTALETLAVIRYGYTTSKIMDTFRKSDLTIFSDKDLSINKNNPAMQFINNAMDRTIKFAFNAVGYGITAMGNAVRLSGAKFNGQYGRLGNAAATRKADADKTRAEIKGNIKAFEKDKKIQSDKLDKLTALYDPSGYLDKNIESRTKLRDEKLQPEYDKLSEEVRVWLKKNSSHGLHDYIEDAMTYIDMGYSVDDDYLNDITEDEVRTKLFRIRHLKSVITKLSDNIQKNRNKKQELEDQAQALSEYDTLIENEKKRLEELDESNAYKYNELMAYWDFLISGKMDSHSMRSKKKKQEMADKMRRATDAFGKEQNMKESQIKFQIYYADYLKKYHMTA